MRDFLLQFPLLVQKAPTLEKIFPSNERVSMRKFKMRINFKWVDQSLYLPIGGQNKDGYSNVLETGYVSNEPILCDSVGRSM